MTNCRNLRLLGWPPRIPPKSTLHFLSRLQICIVVLGSTQAEFLLDVKNDFKLAQALALEAVSCTPSEFRPWYLLTKGVHKIDNYVENALLSLNVCPMSPLKEKYVLLRRVVPFPSE